MEEETWRRAYEGVSKGIYHNGELVATEQQYSDTLAIFLLKAHRPEKFRDYTSIRHEGDMTVRTLVDVAREASNGNRE